MGVNSQKIPFFMFVICSCGYLCTPLSVQNYTLQETNISTPLSNLNESQLAPNLFTNYSSELESEESNSTMSRGNETLPPVTFEFLTTFNYSANIHPEDQIRNSNESESESKLTTEEYNNFTFSSSSSEANLIQDVDDGEEQEDDGDSSSEADQEDEDYIPIPNALANLPHDIPPDRSIVEVMAENAVKDKQYDELRLEELLHELMAHSMGYGEFYPGDIEYDDIQMPLPRAEGSRKKNGRKRHSRRNPNN